MRTIDYLSVFFLLGAAPAWQASLDALSSGLGTSLLIILLIGGIKASRAEIVCTLSSQDRAARQSASKKHI